MFTAASGTFSDGSGILNYANNANCEWMIAPPAASLIYISFTSIDTQLNTDVISVLQCKDILCSQPQQLVQLSGTYSTAQQVTATTGFVRVVFTSDSSINFNGFTASWTTVETFHALVDMIS